MSQLLIIDVQQCFQSSQDLDEPILEFSESFSSVVYLYDTINGEGVFPYDMWNEMAWAYEQDEFKPTVISKEYAFFRDVMDSGHLDDEAIVSLGKLMLKHNINDMREVLEKPEDIQDKFNKILEKEDVTLDYFEDHTMYLPEVLDSLRENIEQNVTLVGGGVNECLREIELCLDILDIKYKINNGFVY